MKEKSHKFDREVQKLMAVMEATLKSVVGTGAIVHTGFTGGTALHQSKSQSELLRPTLGQR